MLVDGDQAEGARRQRIAEDFGHLHPGARAAAGGLGEDQLPLLGPPDVGDMDGIAHALVDRRQPRLARAVQLDDAEQLFFRSRQLLHRMGEPAGADLFGACEHAIALAQRRAVGAQLALGFDHAQPRRRGAVVGLPAVGNGDRLAVLGIDHAQHGDARQAAHAVEGGALAVDQAFLGHVLEQRLELDLLLPLEAEVFPDLALAGGLVGPGDEVEDLLAAGQAGLRLGFCGHRPDVATSHGDDNVRMGARPDRRTIAGIDERRLPAC